MPRRNSQRLTVLALGASLIIGCAASIASTAPAAARTAGPLSVLPDVPSGTSVPTVLLQDWEFAGLRALPTAWAPSWFGNGNTQNGTLMESANVTMGANGVNLAVTATSGSIISTNPNDGQHTHGTGFQLQPTASKPVYVEYQLRSLTAAALENWIGVWMNGQNWPLTGEIDVMESLGSFTYHIEYGPAGTTFGDAGFENPGGSGGDFVPGTHTFGLLWTTKGVTFYYDGVKVGSETASLTGPMYLVAENSNPLSGAAPTPATVTLGYVRVWQGVQGGRD